jgi:hypothetical protein
MNCSVCGRDVSGSCLCGFCFECIKQYGHDNCIIKAKEKKEDIKNKKTKRDVIHIPRVV